jgi:hypothetical protein
MSNKKVTTLVKRYAQLIKDKYNPEMVILQKSYPGDDENPEVEIEVAVVVNRLKKDYIEAKNDLIQLAHQVNSRLDPIIIEREKDEPTGFFEVLKKTGEIIYKV